MIALLGPLLVGALLIAVGATLDVVAIGSLALMMGREGESLATICAVRGVRMWQLAVVLWGLVAIGALLLHSGIALMRTVTT